MPDPSAGFWTAVPDGITIAIGLTPKGGRDALDGVALLATGQSVLKARVRAAPSEGEANAALCRLVAAAVGVPPGRVAIVAGAASRLKRVKVVGNGAALGTALERIARQEASQ